MGRLCGPSLLLDCIVNMHSHSHHSLTGIYTKTTLFLLDFHSTFKGLTFKSTIPGFGLHQSINKDVTGNCMYATTMTEPPQIVS
ncbi:hypothetical protein BGZ63DRAFT_80214 [Mariannaea sp. PMI_226]|nr:hypothetical protein BGZ63DRAFT_80214 [Mariannaea sp. PMI_226]